MAASEQSLLAALLAPCPRERFLDEFWPSRAFVVHGDRARLPAILQDPALSSPAELAQRYVGRLRFTHGGSERMVLVGDVSATSLLDMGLTVQFVDLDRCVPGVADFNRQFEAELGLHEGAVSLSAFASPHDDGLSCHFDAAELFSVQLHGGKDFHHARVEGLRDPCGGQFAPNGHAFDDLYPQVGAGFPDPDRAEFSIARMQPGSVLFLPRGTWHYTEAADTSLSVSIVVDAPPALRCVLDQLRLLMLQDARWRQPIMGGSGDGPREAETRRQFAQLLTLLPDLVAQLTPDDLLVAPARLDWRRRHIGVNSRFQRTPASRIEIGAVSASGMLPMSFLVGHTQALTRRITQVEISTTAAALLRWVEARTDGPFTGADFAAAFPEESFAVLRQVLDLCVQAQFIRLLWFPALDRRH
jgi:ribosomal protein L16 Arg81 hydroxylase